MSPDSRAEMTAAAIARLAGVGRAAVSNWRRRYPEFPQPVGGTASSPTFDRTEVEGWLKATGKADQLATAGRTDTGTRRISEPERSVSTLQSADFLARSMAALLPRETSARRANDGGDVEPAGFSDTADDLPVVLDPACGVGTTLLAVADRFGNRVRLAGQELNQDYARTARFELSDDANGAEYEIYAGDSLLSDQLAAYIGRASAVVCEPPLDSQWPEAELATDPRWEFGIPTPRDGELAWVQHCYAHLRPRGVAVVAVSTRTCVQPSGEPIRAALVRAGVLRDVIALPSGSSSLPATDICLWVLRRPYEPEQTHAPVSMIDLSGLEDVADVPRDFATWQRVLGDRQLDHGAPALSRAVPRLELLDGNANLLPARYVTARAEASADDLAEVTERLTRLYARIGRGLPTFGSPGRQGRTSHVTLSELERVGALTIRSRDITPREGDVVLRTLNRPPIVATGGPDDDKGVAQVVEIDATRLDAHFVATFLRDEVAALPVANTLGAVNRDDLRRCRIPRMPLAEQRQYGDAFRQLLELDAALKALATSAARSSSRRFTA